MKDDRFFFVFDVESMGLRGDGFAAGYVIIDGAGKELKCETFFCDPKYAYGPRASEARVWVQEHITHVNSEAHLYNKHLGPFADAGSLYGVRSMLWDAWERAKKRYPGIVMAADVPWPVEAKFLLECVCPEGDREHPYPIIDVASVRLAAGLDPLETCERLPSEEPAHHPTTDARQSARLLIEALETAGHWAKSISSEDES